MRIRKFSAALMALAAVAFALSSMATRAPAQETILYTFSGDAGIYLEAGLIFDASGNLYGTAFYGGTHGVGTVFELAPSTGGFWTEKVLHNFNNTGKDGYNPLASLVFDRSGNLYGTTASGGAKNVGTVFELVLQPGGGRTEKLLHSFGSNVADGGGSYSNLIFDAKGNLYGTTVGGGAYGQGTVYELTPQPGGTWFETVLHSFNRNGIDGYNPFAGLALDASGNLYGTTEVGGAYSLGTAFELTRKPGGGWVETVLHSFNKNGSDGYYPLRGNLVIDASGNLYGTTEAGGVYDLGTVFELTPAVGGGWTETVLHSFQGNLVDGNVPYAGLVLDASGNLYGTTDQGGAHNAGTVFELQPAVGGGWTEQVLYAFHLTGGDGYYPYGGVILDSAGNLYGTTEQGGTNAAGIAFEIAH